MLALRIPCLAVTLLLASAAAPAQSLRCKGDLASPGDSKASILQKCGEPVLRDTFCEPPPAEPLASVLPQAASAVTAARRESVDEWTYNPGYGQFLTTLRFKNGKLESIRYGDRVK